MMALEVPKRSIFRPTLSTVMVQFLMGLVVGEAKEVLLWQMSEYHGRVPKRSIFRPTLSIVMVQFFMGFIVGEAKEVLLLQMPKYHAW